MGTCRRGSLLSDDGDLAGILDLFEEHVYAGEITPDGHYVAPLAAGRRPSASSAASCPPAREPGEFWESRIHPDDWDAYERFNRGC